MGQDVFLLCPGQGAQAVGMGKAWYDASPAAKAVFDEANDVLGFDLAKLCFEGPDTDLNKTDASQPAIYTTSIASYRGLLEAGTLSEDDIIATAGLSLGEFTALHLAGAFSFADGLKLVRLRGEAMQQAAEASESSMVAVTGDVTEDAINALCDQARGEGILVPANFNSPMQVVVSGSVDACERAVAVASEMGFKPTPLTVAGAFHSPIMQPAADRLKAALDETAWSVPSKPVYANVTAAAHDADVESIKTRMVEQLTRPVRWSQSMQAAVAAYPEAQFHELAPHKVLAGLMRRIERKTKVTPHAEPA